MNILLVSPDYPDDRRSAFSFVKQLVDEMARTGNRIMVLAPYSITRNKRLPKHISYYNVGEGSVSVHRPYYLSLSNCRLFGRSITDSIKSFAYKRGLRRIKDDVDVVYGHFWDSAYEAFSFAKKRNIPLFVASGESEITFRCISNDAKLFCEYVSGVICVSAKNKNESVQLGLTVDSKCIILPNAINPSLFKKKDKLSCRQLLGFPEDSFIVAFVGWFNERKGAKRVSQAISMIRDERPVYSVFIGEGGEEPDCPHILFKGRVPHKDIADYLNAADVFVLPTLHEGCCNAIIEAMACGLPIISSNLPFNADVLNLKNAILVNPHDIKGISEAIRKLRDDSPFRDALSSNALETAGKLNIENRADKVLGFMANNIENK